MDTELKQSAYGVFDTETGQWWAVYAYGTISAAKNSWNAAQPRYKRDPQGMIIRPFVRTPTFNQQERYIVRPIRFQALDIE